MNNNFVKVSAFGLIVLLTGCGKQLTPEQHIDSAKQFIAQSQSQKAIIELKNALSKDQKLHLARHLLGEQYLTNGDFLAAEIEFEKLLNVKYDAPDVVVKLAKARHLLGKYSAIPKLWNDKRGLSTAQFSQLGFYVYIALNNSGRDKEVSPLVEDLFLNASEQTYTKLVVAYQQAGKQQIESSLNTVKTLLLAEPNNPEALLFKGQLLVFLRNNEEAIETFENYLTIEPNNFRATLFLADALVKDSQFENAQPHISKMLTKAPDLGFTNLLQGLVLFSEGKFEDARRHLEKAIQSNTNAEQAKLYAGISAYQLENFELAYEYLSDIIDNFAQESEIVKLYSAIRFQLGYVEEATDSISRLESLSEKDLVLVNNALFTSIRKNDTDTAKELIEKASALNSENAKEITRLGLMKVAINDMSGVAEIQKAIQSSPELDYSRVALIQAYFTQGLVEEAFEAASTWANEATDKLAAQNLAGYMAMRNGDVTNAESYFNRGLELNPHNPASLMYFASKFRNEGDIINAERTLNLLATNNSDYIPGLVNYYLISKQLNEPQKGLSMLRLAVEQSPNNSGLKLLLGRALFTEKDYEQSVSVLKEIVATNATPEFYWKALLRSYSVLQQIEKAKIVAKEWTKFKPESEAAWSARISLNGVANPKSAIPVIEAALQVFPNNKQLAVLLADQYFKAGQKRNVEKLLNSDLLTGENGVTVSIVRAKLAMSSKQYQEANSILLTAQETQDLGEDGVIMLSESYRLLGKPDLALNVVNKALETYTNSFRLLFNKAVILNVTDSNAAADVYNQLLEIDAENPLVLNNLSNIKLKQGKHEEALVYAEKAYLRAANIVLIIDTLANVYIANEKFDKAEKLLAASWNKVDNFNFGFNYALALFENNKKDLARRVLTKLNAKTSTERTKLAQFRQRF